MFVAARMSWMTWNSRDLFDGSLFTSMNGRHPTFNRNKLGLSDFFGLWGQNTFLLLDHSGQHFSHARPFQRRRFFDTSQISGAKVYSRSPFDVHSLCLPGLLHRSAALQSRNLASERRQKGPHLLQRLNLRAFMILRKPCAGVAASDDPGGGRLPQVRVNHPFPCARVLRLRLRLQGSVCHLPGSTAFSHENFNYVIDYR